MRDSALYMEDIEYVSALDLPWEELSGKSILISGASGLIGTFLTDVLMHKNEKCGLNLRIYALIRNEKRARDVFRVYLTKDHRAKDGKPLFYMIRADVCGPYPEDLPQKIEYIIHLAGNTHPMAYSTDPIGTITANVIGTKTLLDLAKESGCERFVLASSNEIYGENKGDTELFDESYLGYIDCNTLRAGYPESKRCAEALCRAYEKQAGLDTVAARFTRTIGPTMKADDTKASSQFIKKALVREDIVLKSSGSQYYSYTYAADALSGLLYVLLKGESGQAYNIADEAGDIRLKDFAAVCASYAGTKVIFEVPDEEERAGYSPATKARLDGTKLKGLGWSLRYPIEEGIKRTIDILKDQAASGAKR